MKFQSKNEAYSYAILTLIKLKKMYENPRQEKCILTIDEHIDFIKIALENHEQDLNKIISSLDVTKEFLTPNMQAIITRLQQNILNSNYEQTDEEKFRNPLARRAESELAITLLQQPTAAMLTAVKRVSNEIIKLIPDMTPDMLDDFLELLQETKNDLALGSYKNPVTLPEVLQLLTENSAYKLSEIMHVHFKLALGIIRKIPIKHTPVRTPVGKLAEIMSEIYPGVDSDLERIECFTQGIADSKNNDLRAYIINIAISQSDLYTALPDRGRSGTIKNIRTNQLGLMLKDQQEYAAHLPYHTSSWVADCKGQSANFKSQHVKDLIENDTVYVAGPSGMTGLLLGQMEMLANFENEDLKKNYLTAVVAYIVGGGFHSIHEVIGPAQYALNLVSGYNIQPPVQNTLAPPPNYHKFFAQQASIDPEFNHRREIAWEKYLKYFENYYAHKHIAVELIATQCINITEKYLKHLNKEKIKHPNDVLIIQKIKIINDIQDILRDGNANDPQNNLKKFFAVLKDPRVTTILNKRRDNALEFFLKTLFVIMAAAGMGIGAYLAYNSMFGKQATEGKKLLTNLRQLETSMVK